MAAGNSNGAAPGRPFKPGESGNPSGRPKGIATAAREVIKNNPRGLLEILLSIAEDEKEKASERRACVESLLDRAYGKAPAFAPIDGENPLDLESIDRRILTVLDELASKREAKAADGGEAQPLARTG